jgi:hypothetical protein
MASGNAQSGREESWLAGLEHAVEGFWRCFPRHKAVDEDTIQLTGTLKLRKRQLLGDVIDDGYDIFGRKVSVELVSSTSVDPSKLQLLTKKPIYVDDLNL